MTLLLTQSEIESLITMREVVAICDQTFQDMGKGGTVNPAKLGLDLGEKNAYPPYDGFMNAMPAYVGWLDVAGLKWAGGFGGRRSLGLPYLSSLILLLDPRTGKFLSVMEGAHITNLRTGAQTAVALKYLKPGQRLRLGLFGAGMQARTQTAAIAEGFEIEQLTVYDVHSPTAEKFAQEMRDVARSPISVAASAEATAHASDVLICVTQAREPFLRKEWLSEGNVVFPMGSYQEIDDAVILDAGAIVVDHVEQCLHRGALKALADAGRIKADDIGGTIGGLANGEVLQRKHEGHIVCIPIGTGALDVAVAARVVAKARESGVGSEIEFLD